MGHPLRNQEKDAIYELGNRTLHQIYALLPEEEVNRIILGLLAKYAWRYGVEIFAFCFMSNHFHLLARCRSLQMHLFMRDFQSQLAKKINKLRNRTGTFWERRYTAIKVLDDDAMVDRLRYIVCNPCESDLVRHPKKWPGLCSWDIHASRKPLVAEVVNRKKYWAEKRKKKNEGKTEAELIELATERYTLEMAKLPQWKDLDDEAYHQKIVETCHEHAGELAKRRKKPCIGPQKVLATSWTDRPKEPKKAPRPLCHGGDLEQRIAYRDSCHLLVDRYRDAVDKWRKGKSEVSFPDGTIPPGHQFCVGGSHDIRREPPPSIR
ncbi:transposase [Persicimonas caeni]|nr:transposase [Persicimonas caeni]